MKLKNSLVVLASALLSQIIFIHSSAGQISPKTSSVNWLRNKLGNRLKMDYMRSDIYLDRWLKANEFNQTKALKALEKTLAWRQVVGTDYLPLRNLSHVEDAFPIDFDMTRDKSGRPVLLIPFGTSWNVRRKTVQGKSSLLKERFITMEEIAAQFSYSLTKDPTAMLIADLRGFDRWKHGCFACIPSYIEFVRHHELYYPYNFYRMVAINTPPIFEPVFNRLRPFMTESTGESLYLFGTNRNRWRNFLLETISPTELPERYGGLKV